MNQTEEEATERGPPGSAEPQDGSARSTSHHSPQASQHSWKDKTTSFSSRSMQRFCHSLAAEKSWNIDIGPLDETVEKASAGVGPMRNPNTMKVHVANLNTDKAKDMGHIGRARKYVIQHVWNKPFTVCNIYAWTNTKSGRDAAAQKRLSSSGRF